MAYTPEKNDARSRVRFDIGDTGATASYSDAEIDLALRTTEAKDFLWLYYDSITDAVASAATVQVANGSTTVEMTLTITDGPYAGATVLDLAGDSGIDLVHELVTAIRDLSAPWNVGFSMGDSIVWLDSDDLPGRYLSRGQYSALLHRRSWDMAIHASALDVLGSANKKRLSIYQPREAARRILISALAVAEDSFTAGNMSVSKSSIESRLRMLSRPVAVGVAP